MIARKFPPECKLAAAVIWLALPGCGTLAEAADTITVDLINATGRRVTEVAAITACTPADATCQIAASIANRATGRSVLRAASGATVGPLLILRYEYGDAGITKSCQLQVLVTKSAANPEECEPGALDATFARTDGTSESPLCGAVTVSVADYPTCTFVLSARMAN